MVEMLLCWSETIINDATKVPDHVSVSMVICILVRHDCDDELHRYPTVYLVTVLPLTIARWIDFGQHAKYGRILAPSVPTYFAVAFFGLHGFFNVGFALSTKPHSGLFGRSTFTEPPPPKMEYEDLQTSWCESAAGYGECRGRGISI